MCPAGEIVRRVSGSPRNSDVRTFTTAVAGLAYCIEWSSIRSGAIPADVTELVGVSPSTAVQRSDHAYSSARVALERD